MIEKYTYWMEFSKLNYPIQLWLAVAIVVPLAIAAGTFLIGMLILKEATLLPIAFGIASFVLIAGYPYMKTEAIISSIEKNFSDALKQMADTLKAGDTYESALREVVNSDYGRLSEEMTIALRRLEEGENFQTALQGFSDRIDSRLVKRTITILLDSVRTGASLSEVLEEISDDVRDFQRLKEDRKANTTMQFLFLLLAGGIIAPAIFGEVNAIMAVFSKVSLQILTAAQQIEAKKISDFILLLIQVYLIIEVVATGVMMSLVREGKLNKSVIYIPLLLLVAFISYYAASIVTKAVVAGVL